MDKPTFDVVCTTIGDGAFLSWYADAIRQAGMQGRVRLVVIPDRATPRALYDAAGRIQATTGVTVVCPELGEQEEFLRKLGGADLIPWDSDNRRNVGFLMALESGAEALISVDDDNQPPERGFFSEHAVCFAPPAEHIVTDPGWFNPCDLLMTSPGQLWARGFPYRHRGSAAGVTGGVLHTGRAEVGVNAGLWLGDPDVDAVTRLATRARAEGMVRFPVVLGPDAWAPVNSQNTAVRRDLIPAFYFLPMGHRVGRLATGRMGDIFGGYFCLKVAKHLGLTARFGGPLVVHARNDHDLFADLRQELPVLEMLDDFLGWLVEVKLTGSTCLEVYRCLAEELVAVADRETWPPGVGDLLHSLSVDMRLWARLCERVGV